MYRRLPNHLAARVYSTSRAVAPPMRRHRTATTVLEALSRAAGPGVFDPKVSRDTTLLNKSPGQLNNTLLHLQKGREAAQFFLNQDPNIYSKFRYAQPHVNAFQPTYTPENVGEDSELALGRLIAALEVSAAEAMFQRLSENGAKPEAVSGVTRLRLLELLAANMKDLNFRTSTREFCDHKAMTKRRTNEWMRSGPAERLFATFEGEERGKEAYQAMIRGTADHSDDERAHQLYAEMQDRQLTPDLPTFNALLRTARSAREGSWVTVLRFYEDLLDAGLEPDVQTFNAMLHGLRNDMASRLSTVLREMRTRRISPNVGTLNALLPLLSATRSTVIESEILSVIDKLLKSPCRHEYTHVEDTMFPFTIEQHRYFMKMPLTQRIAKLYAHSPNLWLSSSNTFSFLMRMFVGHTYRNPAFAMDFYKEHIYQRSTITAFAKLKALQVFARHDPDAVDLVMNDAIEMSIPRDYLSKTNEEIRPFLGVMHQLLELYPACHRALFRSAQYYWRQHPATVTLDSENGCLLIAIALPNGDVTNLEERVAFAWDVFQQMEHEVNKDRLTQASNLLLLGSSLSKLGRFEDAAKVLHRFLTADRLQEAESRVDRTRALFDDFLAKEFAGFLQEQDPDLLALAHKWSVKKIVGTFTGPSNVFRFGQKTVIELMSGHEDRVDRPVRPKSDAEGRKERVNRRVRPKPDAEGLDDRVDRRARPSPDAEGPDDRVDRRARPKPDAEGRKDRVDRRARPKSDAEGPEDRVDRPVRPKSDAEEREDRVDRRARPKSDAEGREDRLDRPARPKSDAEGREDHAPDVFGRIPHEAARQKFSAVRKRPKKAKKAETARTARDSSSSSSSSSDSDRE